MKSFNQWKEDRQSEQLPHQSEYTPARSTDSFYPKTPDGKKLLKDSGIQDVISYLDENGLKYWAILVSALKDREIRLERSVHDFMNKYYELKRKYEPGSFPYHPPSHKDEWD
ncbi:hypothetical protein EBZ39_14230 [bacterium]|nr:hypothetical protein [bacterium]